MSAKTWFLILFLMSNVSVLAQPIQRDSGGKAGFDAERLGKLHAMVQQHIDDNKHAGAVTLIARKGKIADIATFGYRDLEARAPMAADTIFRIYSMSKIITSVAALMLFEEGRFGLDDPVTDYIPELRNLKVLNPGGGEQADFIRVKRPMTIRHLLTHTAGLTYDFSAPEQLKQHWAKADIWNEAVDLKEFVRRISFVPLAHHPGDKFTYGVNTDVLGYLVQVVSGMPFEKFLEDRIFTPLKMVDTSFDVAPEKLNRLAKLLTPGSATLQALVNPGGRNTSASFDFGATTAYGTQLGMTNIGNEYLNILITADVEGLSADTVHHYRATAFNVFGPAAGADVSFRTPFFSLQPPAIAVALPPGAATNVSIALSNHIPTAVNVTNRFIAPPPLYAAVMNPTLTLASYGTANVNLLIDATDLVPDIYEATLEIVSGSTHAVVRVPVQLTVIAAESAQINSVSLQPNGSMVLDFAGTSGYTQTVFASTNLEDWVTIGPATQISPGHFQFTDPDATNFTQRFYKIRTP